MSKGLSSLLQASWLAAYTVLAHHEAALAWRLCSSGIWQYACPYIQRGRFYVLSQCLLLCGLTCNVEHTRHTSHCRYGLPVSSSQCITGAIVGVGLTEGRRGKGVNWRLFAMQFASWVMTLIVVGLGVAAVFAQVNKWLCSLLLYMLLLHVSEGFCRFAHSPTLQALLLNALCLIDHIVLCTMAVLSNVSM